MQPGVQGVGRAPHQRGEWRPGGMHQRHRGFRVGGGEPASFGETHLFGGPAVRDNQLGGGGVFGVGNRFGLGSSQELITGTPIVMCFKLWGQKVAHPAYTRKAI